MVTIGFEYALALWKFLRFAESREESKKTIPPCPFNFSPMNATLKHSENTVIIHRAGRRYKQPEKLQVETERGLHQRGAGASSLISRP